MKPRTWKIGELAKQTRLSIQTLRYYEEIGLLIASERTPAGHRVYGAEGIARLQRILSLRQLGLTLEEIRGCLEQPGYALGPVIDLHLAKLGEQIGHQQRPCSASRTRSPSTSRGSAWTTSSGRTCIKHSPPRPVLSWTPT